MKLQSKLVIAFSVMLILVAITAASGWFAMRDMERMSKQMADVDNSLVQVQSAQLNILRFINSKDKANAQEVEKSLKTALNYMLDAQKYILVPEQKNRSTQVLTDIQGLTKNFATLHAGTDKTETLTADMLKFNADISKNSAQTLDSLEKQLLNNFREQDFKAFYLMNQGDSYFYLVRLYVRVFMADPTQVNAQLSQTTLAKTRSFFADAEKIISTPEGKTAVQQMLKDIDSYNTRLSDFIILNLEIANQILLARTQGINIAKTCVAMSTTAEALSMQSKENGTTNSMAVLLVAIVLGIGITIFLTKNVMAQLGKDPGDLAHIATRVTDGDYNIDDGSPRVGVYDNIVGMVAALKEHIENAQNATEQAKLESARAVEAMKAADLASKDAQAKRDSILVAADRLEEVSQVVSSAAEELSAQIEQSERGAAEQASRVGETATAMEEMNSTVLEVARNAADANAGGKQMREKATDGASIVESSVRGIQRARTDALALKEDMNALSEQAQSIGQIMNVISDIADQTNLLALNAAIEAARAGEAGRGFAVVADEVRKLAEKTMQSTTDVGTAIKTIQASAAKNMAQVDATVKNIEISTDEAEKSGQALREMVEMIDMAVGQVSSIATASEEQSATSEEINRSISQVNTIASETARAMQEAAQAVSDLSRQAQVLTRLIEDMKKG